MANIFKASLSTPSTTSTPSTLGNIVKASLEGHTDLLDDISKYFKYFHENRTFSFDDDWVHLIAESRLCNITNLILIDSLENGKDDVSLKILKNMIIQNDFNLYINLKSNNKKKLHGFLKKNNLYQSIFKFISPEFRDDSFLDYFYPDFDVYKILIEDEELGLKFRQKLLLKYFDFLFSNLESKNFFVPKEKTESMKNNIFSIYLNSSISNKQLQTLWGITKKLMK